MKLIILDRDGVINYDSDEFIKSPDEWRPIPGSLETIARLTKAGYILAIASNQSGVGRGYFSLETLNAINKKMLNAIEKQGGYISALVFCPHLPDDNCDCRKPKPGLLHQIGQKLKVSLDQALVIGDSLRDIQAGLAVNAKAALVLSGKGAKTFAQHAEVLKDIPVYKDLADFVNHLEAVANSQDGA